MCTTESRLSRIDECIGYSRNTRKAGIRFNRNPMVHVAVLHILYGELARKILPQGSAECNVHQLAAAADPDHRKVSAASGGKKTEVETVARRIDRAKFRTLRCLVPCRIYILTACENQDVKL